MKKSNVKLTSLVKTSGCASKLSPGELHSVLDRLPLVANDRLLRGFEGADDALVYSVTDDIVAVETVDFFPPMVDDPYTFGLVASANALSDIYAMGGEPNVALNLMCFPSCLDLSIMEEILRGGLDKAKEAGAVVAGGHTIADPTPKFGMAVTAFMKKSDVWTNGGARVGDKIILTKAIGVGIINTALKGEEITVEEAEEAIESMTRLNKEARDKARDLGVHAATDVTGFSIMGHSCEVAQESGVTLVIKSFAIPFLNKALELAELGFLPEGMYNNYEYIKDKVYFSPYLEQRVVDTLCDPETSGGLLLFMNEDDANIFVSRMNKPYCKIIGEVKEKSEFQVVVK